MAQAVRVADSRCARRESTHHELRPSIAPTRWRAPPRQSSPSTYSPESRTLPMPSRPFRKNSFDTSHSSRRSTLRFSRRKPPCSSCSTRPSTRPPRTLPGCSTMRRAAPRPCRYPLALPTVPPELPTPRGRPPTARPAASSIPPTSPAAPSFAIPRSRYKNCWCPSRKRTTSLRRPTTLCRSS